MSELYDRIKALCGERGITVARLSEQIGSPRSTLSNLNNGRSKSLNAETLAKIAAVLGVSVDYLLGEQKDPRPVREASSEEIKFALFGGDQEITDEMYDEVRRFADYVRQREALKKKEAENS